ncbi:Lpg1974 family pore-forming outer membrane protein [Legionella septentrionalis]
MVCMSQGNVVINAGYMVMNYFDAFHFNDIILAPVETRTSTNFGLYGP